MSGCGTTSNALSYGGTPPNTADTNEWIVGAPIGVWATGNVMNLGRRVLAGAGIQTAALAFGGDDDSGPALL